MKGSQHPFTFIVPVVLTYAHVYVGYTCLLASCKYFTLVSLIPGAAQGLLLVFEKSAYHADCPGGGCPQGQFCSSFRNTSIATLEYAYACMQNPEVRHAFLVSNVSSTHMML